MLRFLKANAMQVAGACQILVGILIAFLPSLTAPQAAVLTGLPTGVGILVGGIVIVKKNGSA